MKRLLAVLFAVAVALPVAADTQVVCSISAQAETACSAITVSQAGQFDQCRCNQNAPAPAGPFGGHATLTDGLVSYWPLGEESGTRVDIAGANDLTDNNTVGFASVTGPPNFPAGKAASFVAANSEFLSLAGGLAALTDGFSVSMWINVADTTRWGLLSNSDGIGPVSYGFTIEVNVFATGDLLIATANDVSTFRYTAGSVVTTDGSAYQHVVVTYDTTAAPDSNRVHVYVNGVEKALTIAGSINVLGVDQFRVGARAADRYYNGKTVHLAAWSRILTAQECTDLYNAGAGLFYED